MPGRYTLPVRGSERLEGQLPAIRRQCSVCKALGAGDHASCKHRLKVFSLTTQANNKINRNHLEGDRTEVLNPARATL
jgi:hypothetical protein